MRMLMNRKTIHKVGILSSLLMVTLYIGHGCSEFKGAVNTLGSNFGLGNTGNGGAGAGFVPKPNVQTAALVYNKQLLDSMVTCTGIGTPSVASKEEWNKRQSSFSEYGYATDVTAPMMMAVAAVSGEVCNDLIKIESVLPSNSRRIFNSIDFSAGPAALGNLQVEETAQRIARSCWSRTPAADELQIIREEVTAGTAGISVTDAAETKKLALLICTGMLASLSGLSF